jgi:hypothetical protein
MSALIEKFTQTGRQDYVTILQLLKKYGFRAGIFKDMVVDKKTCRWHSVSKGYEYSGKFTKQEVTNILQYNVLGIGINRITTAVLDKTTLLYKLGLVSCTFSVHDIRRYYIKKNIQNCKNAVDLIAFSRTIHKNIETTLGYNPDIFR